MLDEGTAVFSMDARLSGFSLPVLPFQCKRRVQRRTLCAGMDSVSPAGGSVTESPTVRTALMRAWTSAVSMPPCPPLSPPVSSCPPAGRAQPCCVPQTPRPQTPGTAGMLACLWDHKSLSHAKVRVSMCSCCSVDMVHLTDCRRRRLLPGPGLLLRSS